jgi:hypothetical protein
LGWLTNPTNSFKSACLLAVSQFKASCLPLNFENLRAGAATSQTQYYASLQEYLHSANLHAVIQSFISPTNAQPICFKIL